LALTNSDFQAFFTRYRAHRRERLNLARFQVFFEEYGVLREQHAMKVAHRLRARLAEIEPDFKAAKIGAAEQARRHAPRFNVFRVLQVSHKESAHSNLLAELLSPQGDHGQGTLFLSSFLRLLQNAGALKALTKNNIEAWAGAMVVHRETTIIGGRCDLTIHAPKRLFVIIENKIHADEGDEQLARYHRWLTKQYATCPNRALIFLTPNGRSAKTGVEGEYMCLSYRPQLESWLADCVPKIRAFHLRGVLEEYVADLPFGQRSENGEE
jgi:hypothetical protein